MTQEADSNGLDPNSSPAAGGEISVPKYRLDETLSRLRATEEALRVKDELINRHMRPQAPTEQINFEEMGLDERTGRAVMRLAEVIADKKVGEATQRVNQQLGHIGQLTEENKFLTRNPGKEAYIERINAERLRHYQTTGGALSMEAAHKIVAYDEMMAKASRPPAQPAAPQGVPAGQAGYQAPPTTPPMNPQGGVGQPQGSPNQTKTFADMSIEETESFLNQQMAANGIIL